MLLEEGVCYDQCQAGRITNCNQDCQEKCYADDTNVMAENEEELKSLLMMVKEESEKFTKIMASGPITSWQIDGEKVEAVTDFIFLCSKSLWTVTAAMKLKDLALWKKSYDQLDTIKKQRSHFANKGPSSQSCCSSMSHVQM